jgi:hypothetical protein
MNYLTIEYPSAGATYSNPEYGVYQYSTYPRSSVLAGQQRRRFLCSYATLAEAQSAHPTASVSPSCGYREPSLDHLPDEDTPYGDTGETYAQIMGYDN